MSTATLGAADLLTLVRKRVNTGAVKSEARRPFRFLLCGDPGLIAEFRALLLRARPEASVPDDGASTLETIDPARTTAVAPDARCVIFFGRAGDEGARLEVLQALKLPVFALMVDADGYATGPAQPTAAPLPGDVARYAVPRIDREMLRGRFFVHLVDRCKGTEVAVGRRLPGLREAVTSKLSRDAASSALKVAAASAVVDHVPLLGFVLGAVASAGDVVAITGIQLALMMQVGAVYGKDPDVQRLWELLPVVGGGLGWRALSRELAGFIPVAGIAIKGAIAYAGTIVVGEGVGFFYEHGSHMTATQAGALYEERKVAAQAFARDMLERVRTRR